MKILHYDSDPNFAFPEKLLNRKTGHYLFSYRHRSLPPPEPVLTPCSNFVHSNRAVFRREDVKCIHFYAAQFQHRSFCSKEYLSTKLNGREGGTLTFLIFLKVQGL